MYFTIIYGALSNLKTFFAEEHSYIWELQPSLD